MAGKDDWELRSDQRFLYSLGAFPMSMVPTLILSWVFYFYCPPEGKGMTVLVAAWFIAAARLFGRIVDAVVDPIVGSWSDRSTNPKGRRIPFVKWGAIPLAICSVLIWYPPFPNTNTIYNGLWLAFILGLVWFFYTVSGVTHLALLPEITYSPTERVHLSVLMSYVDVVAMVGCPIVAGILISKYKGGASLGPIHFADGYKVSALIIAAITVVFLYLSVWKVREKKVEQGKTVPFDLITAMRECFRNEAFVPYLAMIGLLRLGIDLVIIGIPFIATTVMQWDEEGAGYTQGLMILVAAIFFPVASWMAHKYGKKKVYQIALFMMIILLPLILLIGKLPVLTPRVQGLIIFGLAGIPVSALMTMWRPMVADIIDYDEKRVGYRREAIYYGVEGLATKFAEGVSAALVVGLFWLGASIDAARGHGSLQYLIVGPVAAIFFFLAYWVFRGYPLNGHQVNEPEEDAQEP